MPDAPDIDPLLDALNDELLRALPDPESHPGLGEFYRHMRDYPERGGKRLRGLLVLLSTAAHGASWQQGLGTATALELFQNWVLIHDDIEDDSDERRGRPALHKLTGVPIAINVGDALHVTMWQRLHALEDVDAQWWRQIVLEFEWMIQRTAEGQHLDLSWVHSGRFDISEADYMHMVTLKTAYYTVVCPLRLGALCAGRWPSPLLREAGENLGAAFQIRDDILNLTPEVSYGKEFAGDLLEAKRTLILSHLFAQVDAAKAVALEAALVKPRHRKTAVDIDFILDALRTHGSLDYAQRIADAKAKRGLELLDKALLDGSEQPWVSELTRLLESLAIREQ